METLQLQRKSLDQPDETRPVDKGTVEVIQLDAATVMRTTFQPGWRWSEHVKPIAGTDSCQMAHVGYQVSGRMGVRLDDGEEMEYGPGDFVSIPAGHDGWVIGDEPAVIIDWQGMTDYAKS